MAKLPWMRAALGSFWGITVLACNPVGDEALRIQTGFVGMDVRSLRRCMGDAHIYEVREDGSELWAYALPLQEDIADIEISRTTGRGTAHQRPRVENGSPIERETYETTREVEEGKIAPGTCVHLFTLRDGAVNGYRGRGRSRLDMNADATCTVALQRCVPTVAAQHNGE
jgi:hypothetical protein